MPCKVKANCKSIDGNLWGTVRGGGGVVGEPTLFHLGTMLPSPLILQPRGCYTQGFRVQGLGFEAVAKEWLMSM